jgi:rhodanese-related sulfurtransferase
MHTIRSAAVLVLLLLLGLPALASAGAKATDVTVEQAHDLLKARAGKADFVVLDVRTPEEFAQGHLQGAANLNIASPDFVGRLEKLDRTKSYLVYCRTGNRSAHAVRAMQQLGFATIHHMSAGIVGWQQKKFPLIRP